MNFYSFDFDRMIDGSIPLLAPLPTAAKVYEHLGDLVPLPFAFAGALAIELIGFRSMRLQTRMIAHNSSNKNQNERTQYKAPTSQVWAMIIFYLVIAISIVFLMDRVDGLGAWVIAVFPLFGLLGGWFDGLQRGQNQREDAREADRDERQKVKAASKQERKASTQAQGKATSKGKARRPASTSQTSKASKASDDALLKAWQVDPLISNAELGRMFEVSGEAIRQRKNRLGLAGVIDYRQDLGIVVKKGE